MSDALVETLSPEKKKAFREAIIEEDKKLHGILYEYGAEWTDYSKLPVSLDCSEKIEGEFKICGLPMPDGAQAQYNFTLATERPQPGDLAFFGKNKDINQIYHVGLVFDDGQISEARGHQPESSFETGKVILRPRAAWEGYKNFVGYRAHPKLA